MRRTRLPIDKGVQLRPLFCRRPPMTEVGGEAAIYIDPDDPASAATAIAEGLTQRAARVGAGLRNVQRFTSERLVAGYLDAYRHVLGVQDVAATA